MNAPLCLWMTRHPPTPAQAYALRAYTLVQPRVRRFNDPAHAWTVARCYAPQVVVFVLRKEWLHEFVRLSARECQLVRAVMMGPVWCGRWERLKWQRGMVKVGAWTPMARKELA